MKIELTIDLTDTNYLKYLNEHTYTKDEFIFDNLMFFIDRIPIQMSMSLMDKISNNEIDEKELKIENQYIYNIVKPLLQNFKYTLPLNKDYISINLINEINDNITKEELIKIFSFLKQNIDFHNENNESNKNKTNDKLYNISKKLYEDDLLIYQRLISQLELIDFNNKSIDLEF